MRFPFRRQLQQAIELRGGFTVVAKDVEVEILEDEAAAMAEFEQHASALQGLATDMEGMIVDQGEELKVVDAGTANAQRRVARGAHDLGDAREYQRAYRKKMIKIACACGTVLGVMLIVLL